MKLIQAPPILGDVKVASEGPIIDLLHDIKVVRMNEQEDAVVMEVGFCEGEDILNVMLIQMVPWCNIRARG